MYAKTVVFVDDAEEIFATSVRDVWHFFLLISYLKLVQFFLSIVVVLSKLLRLYRK